MPALRFTLDEWMIRLYPGLSLDDPAYGGRADAVRELIWDMAAQGLRHGLDVILDWNFWSAARRRWAVSRSTAAGATVVLHWLTTGEDDATQRALRRGVDGEGYFHEIDRQGNEHLASLIETPTESEGLAVQRV